MLNSLRERLIVSTKREIIKLRFEEAGWEEPNVHSRNWENHEFIYLNKLQFKSWVPLSLGKILETLASSNRGKTVFFINPEDPHFNKYIKDWSKGISGGDKIKISLEFNEFIRGQRVEELNQLLSDEYNVRIAEEDFNSEGLELLLILLRNDADNIHRFFTEYPRDRYIESRRDQNGTWWDYFNIQDLSDVISQEDWRI